MKRNLQAGFLIVTLLFGLGGLIPAQNQSGGTKLPPLCEQECDEVADMKVDLANMQSLLNQMQVVFALVGNTTAPANHELDLNMDMWRVLIQQMQRRIQPMERTGAGKKR